VEFFGLSTEKREEEEESRAAAGTLEKSEKQQGAQRYMYI